MMYKTILENKFEEELSAFTVAESTQLMELAFVATAHERMHSIDLEEFKLDILRENYELCDSDYRDYLESIDEYFYSMDEFNDVMSDYTPNDIADMVHFGNFSPLDNYFKFDGYGNIKTFSYLEDLCDDDDVYKYLLDNMWELPEPNELINDNEELIENMALALVDNGY